MSKKNNNKRTYSIMDFAIPADHPVKIKKKKRKKRQLLRPCQRTEKAVEHETDGDTNCNWCTWNGPQRIGKRTGRV